MGFKWGYQCGIDEVHCFNQNQTSILGIESASSPRLYSLDVHFFRQTVFPRELGLGGGGGGGGPYSLRVYGPPD